MTPDAATELGETLALGHATGEGVIAAVARAPNYGLIDPTIRQARYWRLLVERRRREPRIVLAPQSALK